MPLTRLAVDGRTDQLSGSFARRPSGRPLGRDAGSGTLRGAGEEGQEEGHGNLEELSAPGGVGLILQ